MVAGSLPWLYFRYYEANPNLEAVNMVETCSPPKCHNRRGRDQGRAFKKIPNNPEHRKGWIIEMKCASDQLWGPL